MKIFYDLSKLKESKTFKYDAKLINGVQIGLVVFILLSSITIYSGLQSHLHDLLIHSFILWRWLVNLAAYIFGSLCIDLVNAICLAFVVGSILRQEFKGDSIFLMLICIAVTGGLTYYSFNMSQNSALVVGNDIRESNQRDDTPELRSLDNQYASTLSNIESTYGNNYQKIISPFEYQVSNIEKSYANQIQVLKNEIAVIDANSSRDNYLYALKQKKPLTAEIQRLETEKGKAIAPILSKQQKALEELLAQKNRSIQEAESRNKSDRNKLRDETTKHNTIVTSSSNVFSDLFSKLAGFSVFIMLCLVAIREVLFHRNNIEPEPILSNFDFSPGWLIEVLGYPVAWVRSHSVAIVREKYKSLPDPEKPPVHDKIWDGKSLNQEVIQPKQEEVEEDVQQLLNEAQQRPKNLKTNNEIVAYVPTETSATDKGAQQAETTGGQLFHENETAVKQVKQKKAVAPEQVKRNKPKQPVKQVTVVYVEKDDRYLRSRCKQSWERMHTQSDPSTPEIRYQELREELEKRGYQVHPERVADQYNVWYEKDGNTYGETIKNRQL